MKNIKLVFCIAALSLFIGSTAWAKSKEKEIKISAKSLKDNKFGRPDGQFSYDYKAESENLVLFWDKSFGKNPATYADKFRRFYPDEILREGERFYTYYVDKLKFADKKKSLSSRYKMIIWMYNDDKTTAYGWGEDGVGMMWMRPCRAQSYPYCALAHEMGHSFQFMVGADGSRGFAGHPLVEYTSQWMLWQVYSDWTTIEQFHLDAYMDQTHYSLLNEINQYHAPQFMEYWSNKHGLDIIARIWKEAVGKEDPVLAYQRLTRINQEQFNDEIYEAATRFVTWDIPRVERVCSSYANQHRCKLDKANEGWYQIAQSRCPQNYGYNVIRLNVPNEGETTFHDEIYGDITVPNAELDDMILIKSDGYPTYNFANVIDDHLMGITHVVRGNEYLSSAPKYNRIYEAFGWEIPVYVHCPLITNEEHQKLSKRSGHSSYEDLLNQGFVTEAIVNFVALLGWSPQDNREIFSLPELVEAFDYHHISKSPAVFDITKLRWMNGEYIKKMDPEVFYERALPYMKEVLKGDFNFKKIAGMVQTRIETFPDIPALIDFFQEVPDKSNRQI